MECEFCGVELTSSQEDCILEEGRERDFENKVPSLEEEMKNRVEWNERYLDEEVEEGIESEESKWDRKIHDE